MEIKSYFLAAVFRTHGNAWLILTGVICICALFRYCIQVMVHGTFCNSFYMY